MVYDKPLEMWCHMKTMTYVVGLDVYDAIDTLEQSMGEDCPPLDLDVWMSVPDDKPIRADNECTDGPETKTAAEWIAATGRGFMLAESVLWVRSRFEISANVWRCTRVDCHRSAWKLRRTRFPTCPSTSCSSL